jgi:hypothetical protein
MQVLMLHQGSGQIPIIPFIRTYQFCKSLFTDTSGISSSLWDRFHTGGFMDILSAIKREERRLEKQLASVQHKLKGIKAAAEAMGRSAEKKVTKGTKRVLSAAARAKMGKAARKRWARIRAEAKKMAR